MTNGPTADQVDALVALVDDDVTFGDYLAEYRTRCPPEPTRQSTRRMLHRRRQYLIPGTTLLRINFGADSHGMLADDVNIRAIHQELSSDVYAWAGNYRVTELRRGEDVFAPPTHWPINLRGSTPTSTTFIRFAKTTGEPAQ